MAALHDQIEEEPGGEERLAFLAAQGMVTLPKGETSFVPLERAEAKGGPVSESILVERK